MKFLTIIVVFLLATAPAFAGGMDEMNQGSSALRRGDFAAAVEHMTAALDSGELAGEAFAATLISRGQARYLLANYRQAAEDLTAAIESGAINDTLVGIALASRASAYRMMGEWGRAVADFDAAIELGTINDKMFFHRGLALEADGQRARAIEDFRRAYRTAPENEIYRAKLLELGETVE